MTLSPRVRRLSWGEAKDVSRRHYSISCSKVMYKTSYSRVWCRALSKPVQLSVRGLSAPLRDSAARGGPNGQKVW